MGSMNITVSPYVKSKDIPNKMKSGLNQVNNVHCDSSYEHQLGYENVVIQITRT